MASPGMTQTRRAPFIVIEGLDRSGKTTQTANLLARLKKIGVEACPMKFPGEHSRKTQALLTRLTEQGLCVAYLCTSCIEDRTTAIGQMIDSYLRSASELDDRAVHLLFSANRWELASTIEKTLLAGTPVICDRYAFSGIAFSASKVKAEGGPLLPFEWCRSPDIGLPAPDVVLFFDITPEKAKERGGYGEERYEKEEMQARVRQFFHRIGDEGGVRWVSVDAGRERESVEKDVWAVIDPLVREGVEGPVQKLWTA